MKKATLILISTVFLLTGCQEKKQVVFKKGKISEIQNEEIRRETEESKLYRNIKKGSKIKIENKDSWYFNNILSDRAKICFGEVKNAIDNYQKEVVFSKPISENEFQIVMNIIYLDTPESFPLKYKYKYEVDENGNVKKALYDFVYDKTTISKTKEELQDKFIQIIKESRNQNDIDAVKTIVDIIRDKIKYVNKADIKNMPMNHFTTIKSYSDGFSDGSFPLSIALSLAANLRHIGLDCVVKCGTLTSDNLNLNGRDLKEKPDNIINKLKEVIEPPTFKNTDITKYKDIVQNGNTREVLYHPEKIYCWLLVKVDNQWLNVDPYYDKISQDFTMCDTDTNVLVPDFILSNSRTFAYNENIFGVTPTSTMLSYLQSVKDKSFVLHKNKQEIIEYINNEVSENIKNRKDSYYRQFEDKETMNKYLREYDSIIKKINKENENIISSYDINYDYSRLLVEINNIKYSG